MAKTWTEKFNSPRPHEVKPAPMDIAGMKKGEIMLVPSARIIAEMMATIPSGKSIEVRAFRLKLAKKYKAQVTCPITTGILMRIVAEAALEAKERGAKIGQITPFWRVIEADAPAAKKLSCGPAFIAKMRRAEGI